MYCYIQFVDHEILFNYKVIINVLFHNYIKFRKQACQAQSVIFKINNENNFILTITLY